MGDFNGDGRPDVAAVGQADAVSVWLDVGGGALGPQTTYAGAGGNLNSVATGDFRGNGELDLAVTDAMSEVTTLFNQGGGAFAVASSQTIGDDTEWVAVGDFNGDGLPDLAVTVTGGSAVSVLLNEGGGTFAAPVSYAVGVGQQPLPQVAVGDFNGDGWLDLAVVNSGADDVSVLLNQGGGTFAAPVVFAVGHGPIALAVGDFNGDGKPDLAVVNETDATVDILLSDCSP